MSGGMRPVAVLGPTGSGKSALGLALAHRLGGEIVNIDAMQQYRGMDIGTAKVPFAEREGISHHQIDTLDVTETATVARYQEAAAADVERLLARGIVPIVVGGSMLYVQSLFDRWEFPATDPEVRGRWEARLAAGGPAALHAELGVRDPEAAATILPSDGRRIVRALEVGELTGRPFAASRPRIGRPRWDAVLLGLRVDVGWLDPRLRSRTSSMFAAGLVDEVRELCDRGLRAGVTARRAIGYAQVLAYLDGDGGLADVVEATFVATRRYVRRQRSWFGRDPRIHWLDAAGSDVADAAFRVVEDSFHDPG